VTSSARAGASPTNTAYTYDAAGNILTLVDGRGTTRYHYDKAQELDQVTESGGNIDIFGYNKAHQVVDSYYGTSGTNGGAATYDSSGNTLLAPAGFAVHQQSLLDTAGRLQETVAYRASANTPGNRVMDLSYCYSPQVPGQGCPTGSGTKDSNKRQYSTDNLTGAVTTYSYDQGGRLHSAVTLGGPHPGDLRLLLRRLRQPHLRGHHRRQLRHGRAGARDRTRPTPTTRSTNSPPTTPATTSTETKPRPAR